MRQKCARTVRKQADRKTAWPRGEQVHCMPRLFPQNLAAEMEGLGSASRAEGRKDLIGPGFAGGSRVH